MGSPPPGAAAGGEPDDTSGARGGKRAVPLERRGKDWAFRQKPHSVAVRRTIRVVVRQDRLVVMNDNAPSAAGPPNGKVVPLEKATVLAIDDFVKQVHEQIDGWGIAGNGLYWRPVIVLTVAPDGQRRADDLNRLLRNSGLELKYDETATNAPASNQHETR
jgi:hypothetical protein